MTIRNWFKFSVKALLIGGLLMAVLSIFIRWNDYYAPHIAEGDWLALPSAFIWFLVLGFTMSLVAQMGFFAYLTIHQIGVNIFKSLTLWNWVQMLIIAIVIFDIIYFRFRPRAEDMNDWLLYTGLLITLIAGAIATAIKKVQLTGKKHVLVSAVFFMIVLTTIEWLIALWIRTEGGDQYIVLFLFPLMAVNAFQLLSLPKYNAQSDIDRQNLEERRAARRKKAQEESASK